MAAPASGSRLGRVTLSTVLGLLFVAWGVYIGTQPLSDNSAMTHLATGRLILDGGLPRVDPYSFTAAGEPWVVQSWLPAAAYALLERWFGPGGLLLYTAACGGALGAIVWRLTAPARGLLVRTSLGLLALLVGAATWSERPLLIGLLGIGLLLVQSRRPLVPYWVLVPLFWLWVNSHGSFPLGLVLVALLWAGARLDGEDGAHERSMVLWSLAGTVAGVASPLGLEALTFPVDLLGRQEALTGVVEWQSPDFADLWTRAYLVQVVVFVLALARRPSWRAALPAAVMVAASLVASRNVAVASLVLVAGSAPGLAGLGHLTGRELRGLVPAAAGALLAAMSGLLVAGAVAGGGWQLDGYPVEPLAWASERSLLGPTTRLLAEDYVGNLVEVTWGGEVRVFLDDRFDMYPLDVIEDYRTFATADPGWELVLDRHEIDTVVWSAGEPVAALLAQHPGWQVRYQDGDWVVVTRRSGADPAEEDDLVPGSTAA